MKRNALKTMMKDYKVTVPTLPPEDQKKMMVAAMKQWDKAAAKDAAICQGHRDAEGLPEKTSDHID